MAIDPINNGEVNARAKLNAAIAKANLVDSKADKATVDAGFAGEATARQNALLALPLPMPVQHRPGDAPLDFGRSLADGEAVAIAPVPEGLLRYDEAGKVVRLTGDDVVAPRHLYALEPGRRYLATFAVQRRVNSPDPDNDAIRCAMAWYGQGKGRLLATPQTVAQDLTGLTVGSGRQVVRAVVARAAGADVDIVAPAGARYVRPYVQTYGTLVQNDVEVISWADITDAVAFAPDVSALEARVAAVESLDLGDRVSEVEAQITAPNSFRFSTVGDLEASSVPVIVDSIEVLGSAAPGDGGQHRRKRVALASAATMADVDGTLWEIAEPIVSPEMLGGDVQLSMDAAAAIGAKWRASPKLYTFSQIVIPDDLQVTAAGATFRHDGSTAGSQVALVISDGVLFDEIFATTPGTETAANLISVGKNVRGMSLFAISDVQRAGRAITGTGEGVCIERIMMRRFDDQLWFDGRALAPNQPAGCIIGIIDGDGYLTGARFNYLSFNVGYLQMTGRSSHAAGVMQGQNGVLVEGCADWNIGPCYIEGSNEHAFRIGGSRIADAETRNYRIGVITAENCRGCPFKINPSLQIVAPDPANNILGVTEKAWNGTVAGVVGIDCGDGAPIGNMDATRFTHIRGLRVGFIRLYRNDAVVSGQYGAILNDCDDVEIGGLSGDALNAAFVLIDGTNDVDGVNQFGGPVTNLRIYGVAGSCAGQNALAVSTTFDVGNVLIELDGITGYATNLCRWISGNLTGPFRLIGCVNGNTNFQGMPASDLVFIDIEQGGKRRVGRPDAARFLAGLTVSSAGFDLAATPAVGKFGALFASAVMATAGAGTYGGSVVLGRPGSDRRGVSLVAKQGASASAVGLSVMTGVGATAADQQYEHIHFDPGGDLELFTAGKGSICRTPDGTKRYRIGVDNAGAVTATLIP